MGVNARILSSWLCVFLPKRASNAAGLRSRLLVLLLSLRALSPLAAQSLLSSDTAHPGLFASSEPTGAERCAVCHQAEVDGYARSAMAHSLRPASQEPDGIVNARGTKITMRSRSSGYWQTWESAGDRNEYKVDYVVGSGNHASGYLVNIGGHLFQSPVAFYKSRQSYDLAPGYENTPDPDFTRPIGEDCLLCHSGKALYIAGTLNSFRAPIFGDEGISCERCHGPVERHLAHPRAGTIVNPAKLEPSSRDSVCEQCHLFGAARVPNPGKRLSDFVAGQRLEDTFTVFHDAVPSGTAAGDFKVISHVEQLALSACARNSNGRLWCGTCHNPHDKPAQPVQYYRSRCLSCHTAAFPNSHPAKDSDCLACHMPRRDAKDGGHSAFTDHRIERRPETLPNLPANTGIVPWRQPPLELQKRNLGIAYIDVGMQRHSSQFVVEGYRILTEVQRQFSDDPDFFKWIGEALLLARETPDAKLAFNRVLQLEPASALGEAGAAAPYMVEGNVAEATAHLERAVALDPLYLPAASTLIDLYKQQGKLKQAAELSARISAALDGSAANPDPKRPSTSAVSKNAEEQFKNIRVLKGLPANQLIPAMKFITSSLGVDCAYCHVEDEFDKDEKKKKETARAMLQMVHELNANHFDGQREITCFSCHRGQPKPESTPILDASRPTRPVDATPEQTVVPSRISTLNQILRRYVDALGGATALSKLTTRIARGAVRVSEQSGEIEIFTETPGKQATVRRSKQGESTIVFDGQTGWRTASGRSPREIQGAELGLARLDADLQFALHVTDLFPDLRVQYPELIGGRKVEVVVGVMNEKVSCKLYFDQESGLLVRMVRLAESAIGRSPSQVDFADYRAVDGVQVPFRMVQMEPTSTTTIQLDEVRHNVPIDWSGFVRPLQAHAALANSKR
jgi:tetratricopeptide (TPR) repeat protein